MANLLLELEKRTGLTVMQCAMLLGYAKPTYYQYRRSGELPLYAQRHVQALLLLPERTLNNIVKEHVIGDDL